MSSNARTTLIFLIFNILLISPLQAKIRKCVLSDGHIIFTDIACPQQTIPHGQKKQLKSTPFDGMSDAQKEIALAIRNKKWKSASATICMTNIDKYAKTIQPDFSEIIVKNQHKLVSSSQDKKNVEYIHRISFFFMAGGTEWESSGNCHATLSENSWNTNFKRVTTGIPFISARKQEPQNIINDTDIALNEKDKKKEKNN